MADVPRLYMPIYIMIRVPLLMLFGAALTMISAQWLLRASPSDRQQREITLLSLMVIVSAGLPGDLAGPRLHRVAPFPVLDSRPCGPVRHRPRQVDCGAASPRSRGCYPPALRSSQHACCGTRRPWSGCTLTNICTTTRWSEVSKARRGATISTIGSAACPRPSTISKPICAAPSPATKSCRRTSTRSPCAANACRSRKRSRFPSSNGISGRNGSESDFFIAPTQLNCDGDVDGKIIGTVERLGVVIAYIKDLRAPNPPETTARR